MYVYVAASLFTLQKKPAPVAASLCDQVVIIRKSHFISATNCSSFSRREGRRKGRRGKSRQSREKRGGKERWGGKGREGGI